MYKKWNETWNELVGKVVLFDKSVPITTPEIYRDFVDPVEIEILDFDNKDGILKFRQVQGFGLIGAIAERGDIWFGSVDVKGDISFSVARHTYYTFLRVLGDA